MDISALVWGNGKKRSLLSAGCVFARISESINSASRKTLSAFFLNNRRCNLEGLLGAFDDFILQFLAEVVEVIAVAGDPDDKIFVVFRVLLRV